MDHNRLSKQQKTTTKDKKPWKAAHYVETNLTDNKEISEILSRALDDLAVNEHVIQFRRKIMLSSESELTLTHKGFGRNKRTYIFGSQIEGTSTIGMMSDVDILYRFDTFCLFLDSENPPIQPHDHQIVIKVSTSGCAPQFCVLKRIEPSTLARRFQNLVLNTIDIADFFRWDWTNHDGRIPNTVMFDIQNLTPEIFRQATRHGPAKRYGNIVHVNAWNCKSLPEQCKFVFERPRPGHWPSEKTLKKAKTYGVFIVPQGTPKSTNICTYDYCDYQWRISTNLTERLFMFSLDTIHLKAYVLTKMIRKELFGPEYRDRLSTFHFKTAFFFAVENNRSDLWREDNLINCVKYILATLRRFLMRHNCPHFTIENVNLFDGKIERHEFQKLVQTLKYVINSLRTTIEHIQMDNLGNTFYELSTRTNERSTYCTNDSSLLHYVFNYFEGAINAVFETEFLVPPDNARKDSLKNEFTSVKTYSCASLGKYQKYAYVLHDVMSRMASFFASACLEQKAEEHELDRDSINKARHMYEQTLEADIIGTYMRYASFLFCNGEFDEACTYFDLIEKKIKEDKKCNLIYQLLVSQSELLAVKIAKQSSEQSFKQRWSVFLLFRRAESMCVPVFLRCELYRGRFGTLTFPDYLLPFCSNDECICVQIEPYLYYLQYLTYKLLNQEPKRTEALMKLFKCITLIEPRQFISSEGDIFFISHSDTSLNMLGHCFELEQNLKMAWVMYATSAKMLPQRNAAVLHIIRLLWQVYQRLRF
ncbi:hypothetical protein DPMN_073537 [Dreissena polymorpha]|uniref:Mab-21-like HhH/H2TH-like domain-containing protein n=1 Tax=Dreissena polymorpha TaxID=45954 RepID=A0A9D4BZ69_DREPO|nr:hypothetical protein DPMN_073537 [Dreissena polymorpha]